MIDRVETCMMCEECVQMRDTQTIRLWKTDREHIEIVGHIRCSEIVWKKIKSVKDRDKKSPQKILNEIGFKFP